MCDKGPFERETKTRRAFGLSADYVLEMLESFDGDSDPRVAAEGTTHGFPKGYNNVCVMPAAQRTL